MSGPLTGVRVLDLTHFVAGPWCTMLLADLGADVVKIEPPAHGEIGRTMGGVYAGNESAIFLGFNRGKRSVALDLKHDVGRRLAQAMAGEADVVVQNFRPGTAERLGMDAATLRRMYPRLIYCAVSAFGADGPAVNRPANDPIIQALAGAMQETGGAEARPVRMGVSVPDLAGGVLAATAIAAALFRRERGGEGCDVELNLLDAELYAQTDQMTAADLGLPPASVDGIKGAYLCADGEGLWIEEDDADVVAPALGLPIPAGKEEVTARLLESERNAALEALAAAGLTAVPVCRLSEVLPGPATRTMDVQHSTIGTLSQVRIPVTATPPWPPAVSAPPLLGQHTRAVLQELGATGSDIDHWRREGILRETGPRADADRPSRIHR